MDIGFKLGSNPLTFDESLYYIIVTCSSVGYGDYSPKNDLSQFLVLFFVIVVIGVLINTTSKFNEITKVKNYI